MPFFPSYNFPMVGNPEAIVEIRSALDAREPFSFIRLGFERVIPTLSSWAKPITQLPWPGSGGHPQGRQCQQRDNAAEERVCVNLNQRLEAESRCQASVAAESLLSVGKSNGEQP